MTATRHGPRRERAILATCVGWLGLATAHAALAPQYYQQARENAASHLQLRIDEVVLLPDQQSGNCEVRGTVLRDFRGNTEPGTPLRFHLNCQTPEVTPMPGSSAWHDYERLRDARFAEGFFNASAPVHGQLAIIAAERESPWCEATSGRCDLAPAEPAGTARVLECVVEGEPPERMRVGDGTWQEWDGAAFSPQLCGRHASDRRQRVAWSCDWQPHAWTLEYASVDSQSQGVYRRVETLDPRTGAYHRRITDDTFVLESGSRLEFNHYGQCRPVPD